MSQKNLNWTRNPGNPVFPPQEEFDSGCCMNPFLIVDGNTWRLFYAGCGEDNKRKICFAEAETGKPETFSSRRVVLDSGEKGCFDDYWLVLPCLHKFGNKWYLYYTGRDSDVDKGLQSFTGVGLAVSDDGVNFKRHSNEPIFSGNCTEEFPDNKGVAGGGTILEFPEGDRTLYRMYYTVAVGTPNEDVMIDQEKHCAVCHSYDGIDWFDHRIILSSRKNITYENIACAAPFVWRDSDGLFRMYYSAIGTRWGYYSLAEAWSVDGYDWQRSDSGEPALKPSEGEGWDSQMVEYPFVLQEEGKYTLFYCGNGYGRTGIGCAVAER
ncbi:MAG: glycoside hydrolase family protein [Planctomycetota bacterium]|jgi:predicted GH43/DUF377 family glycosyl hydrolase